MFMEAVIGMELVDRAGAEAYVKAMTRNAGHQVCRAYNRVLRYDEEGRSSEAEECIAYFKKSLEEEAALQAERELERVKNRTPSQIRPFVPVSTARSQGVDEQRRQARAAEFAATPQGRRLLAARARAA